MVRKIVLNESLGDKLSAALAQRTDKSGASFGSAVATSADGTKTAFGELTGTAGIIPFIGDTTPPPVPSPPKCDGSAGVLVVGWDGAWANSVEATPPDFAGIIVEASSGNGWAEVDRTITAAGSVPIALTPGDYEVRLRSFDNAHDESLASAPNVSEPSVVVAVTVQAVDAASVQEAIDAGVAAQQKADAAKAAADAAQSDATLAREQLDGVRKSPLGDTVDDAFNAANEAQTAADKAKADAKTAQEAADAAAVTASAASAAANGAVTWSTANASGTPVNPSTVWFRYASNGTIIGQWRWSGTAWVVQQLDNAVIANLDAGKIVTGLLDAARIKAGSITVDKLQVDTAMLVKFLTVGFPDSKGRTMMNGDRIRMYNSAGQVTIDLDATTGTATFVNANVTGTFRTGTTGNRVEITKDSDTASKIMMWPGGNYQPATIYSDGSTGGIDMAWMSIRSAYSIAAAEKSNDYTDPFDLPNIDLQYQIDPDRDYATTSTINLSAEIVATGPSVTVGPSSMMITGETLSAVQLEARRISGGNDNSAATRLGFAVVDPQDAAGTPARLYRHVGKNQWVEYAGTLVVPTKTALPSASTRALSLYQGMKATVTSSTNAAENGDYVWSGSAWVPATGTTIVRRDFQDLPTGWTTVAFTQASSTAGFTVSNGGVQVAVQGLYLVSSTGYYINMAVGEWRNTNVAVNGTRVTGAGSPALKLTNVDSFAAFSLAYPVRCAAGDIISVQTNGSSSATWDASNGVSIARIG